MTVIEHSTQAAEALQAFLDAPDGDVHASLRRLDAVLRQPAAGDRPAAATAMGHAAVSGLARALAGAPADRLPHLVLLLGLLADTDAHDAVRAELDILLGLIAGAPTDRRLVAALLFTLGFLGEDRERIQAAADAIELSPDDRTRLE